MKPMLALLFLFSLSHADIQVTELFRAETPAELEAALVDGYPMPWLAEVLADSTIPEEDRYWLDCRMRAAIARDLNLFFDRDGNRVEIDCDYMHPGESYWREHFIVNPPGESFRYDSENRPADVPFMQMEAQPGYIVNLYGERVGDIAITRDRVWLSRDASVGIFRTGNTDGIGYNRACFLYPDGSFLEQPIDLVFVQYALSQDGNVAVFYSIEAHDRDQREPAERMLYAFDREGELIFERLMPSAPLSGSATPAISPDSRYIAAPLSGGEVWLLDAHTGDVIHTWGGTPDNMVSGSNLFFTQDSRYLCAGSVMVFDCGSGERILKVGTSEPYTRTSEGVLERGRNTCMTCNGAELVSNIFWTNLRPAVRAPYIYTSTVELRDREANLLFSEPCEWLPFMSPNGAFLLGERYNSLFFGGAGTGASSTPLAVMRLLDVE